MNMPTSYDERASEKLKKLREKLDEILSAVEDGLETVDSIMRLIEHPLESGQYMFHDKDYTVLVDIVVDEKTGECISMHDKDGRDWLGYSTDMGLWDADNPNCILTK